MCGDQKVDSHLPSLLQMNLLDFQSNRSELSTRYELSPVLCQFIEQDIHKDSLGRNMQAIISHYAVVLKDVYRQVAFFNETQGEEAAGASPTEIYSSPRKQMTIQSAFSFNDSQDSLLIDQLSGLKGGLQKGSLKTTSGIVANLGVASGIWPKQPTIDISLPDKASFTLQDWPNLEHCMSFLVNLNSSLGSDNHSFMKENNESPGQDEQAKLCHSGRNMFNSTCGVVKTNVSGSDRLNSIQQNNINRLSSRNLTKITNDFKATGVVFESASSISSSPGNMLVAAPSLVNQVSSDDSMAMNRQSSLKQCLAQPQRKSILVSQTANSHLPVIDEFQEHCRSNNSQ